MLFLIIGDRRHRTSKIVWSRRTLAAVRLGRRSGSYIGCATFIATLLVTVNSLLGSCITGCTVIIIMLMTRRLDKHFCLIAREKEQQCEPIGFTKFLD